MGQLIEGSHFVAALDDPSMVNDGHMVADPAHNADIVGDEEEGTGSVQWDAKSLEHQRATAMPRRKYMPTSSFPVWGVQGIGGNAAELSA